MTSASSERVIVRIDAELLDLVRAYLANRIKDVQSIRTALEQHDFAAIVRIGHNLHGSGRTFGFEQLTTIGAALQRAADAAEDATILQLQAQLSDFISRVEVKTEEACQEESFPAVVPHRARHPARRALSDDPCVLVVDDQEMNRLMVSRYLEKGGYAVRQAASGEEALAALAEPPLPVLILLDVVMAGINGLEVCRRIKRDPRTRDIPVVLVTGSEREEDRARAIEVGADGFLSKPVERCAMLALARALAPRSAAQASPWQERTSKTQ